jgi:hypothetical protein
LDGLATWLFIVASVIGFWGGPVWLLIATGGFLVLLQRGERPTRSHVALFAALSALVLGYLYQASLD